jgi:hypothetical protein
MVFDVVVIFQIGNLDYFNKLLGMVGFLERKILSVLASKAWHYFASIIWRLLTI